MGLPEVGSDHANLGWVENTLVEKSQFRLRYETFREGVLDSVLSDAQKARHLTDAE
jgi:hypothetical protein